MVYLINTSHPVCAGAGDPNCQLAQRLSTQPNYPDLLLLLSRFSRVRPCATPEMAAHQAPPSLGFYRQEHWNGLPFPPPMRESEVAQSCPTLSDLMDCSPPGSSVHGVFQARVLEWIAIAFSDPDLTCALKGSPGRESLAALLSDVFS